MAGVTGLAGRTARMTRGDGEQTTIDVEQAGLDPAEVVRLVGGYLEAVGDTLRGGDVIIAGSLLPAVPLGGDERVELEIDGLGSVALEISVGLTIAITTRPDMLRRAGRWDPAHRRKEHSCQKPPRGPGRKPRPPR